MADLAELRSLETESSDEDQEEAESHDAKNEHTAIDVTGIKTNGIAEDSKNEKGDQK